MDLHDLHRNKLGATQCVKISMEEYGLVGRPGGRPTRTGGCAPGHPASPRSPTGLEEEQVMPRLRIERTSKNQMRVARVELISLLQAEGVEVPDDATMYAGGEPQDDVVLEWTKHEVIGAPETCSVCGAAEGHPCDAGLHS